jgi:AcrR family transcriptional regulator
VKATTVDDQHLQPEKRTRMSGEERRALILRSAKRVFARSTYAEASTGKLARESEITEPMLYKHFGSKKGLFLAVLAEFGRQFFVALQESVERRAEKDLQKRGSAIFHWKMPCIRCAIFCACSMVRAIHSSVVGISWINPAA